MVRELKPCKEGYVRNPLTNRCQKIRLEGEKEPRARKAKEPKPCRDDQYRNPATGRCKKIQVEGEKVARAPRKKKDPKPCKETQYRNPATGRCKNLYDKKGNYVGLVGASSASSPSVAPASPDRATVEAKKGSADKRRKDAMMKKALDIPDYHRMLADPTTPTADWKSANLMAVKDINKALQKVSKIPVSKPSKMLTEIDRLEKAVDRVLKAGQKGISLADIKKRKEMLGAIEFHNSQFSMPNFDMPAGNITVLMEDIQDGINDILSMPQSEPDAIAEGIDNLAEAVAYVAEQNKKGISLAQLRLRKKMQG